MDNIYYGKGYGQAGASRTKRSLKGFTAKSGSPREDIDWNNLTLRQRSRMLYMSTPIATSAIDTNRTKVVGTGLTLKAQIDRTVLGMTPEQAKDWQRQTEAEFRLWASKAINCDATGINTFGQLQQLVLKCWLMSGDVFAVIKRYRSTKMQPYTLRIHLVEADRVSTPDCMGGRLNSTEGVNPDNGNRIFDGVEVDGNGAVVAYHIRNTYPYQVTSEQTVWTRVEAYGARTGLPNVIHIMDAERADQYRGVPYLAKVVEPLLQLRRFTESELDAALVQSYFTGWIKTTSSPTDMPFNEVGGGDIGGIPGQSPDESNIAVGANEYEMGPGTVLTLDPDEDIVFGNPNIPSVNFETFTKCIARMCGAGLEIPYDVLLKEFDSSYSASRGALLEAWEAFKVRRQVIKDFDQTIYELFLTEAVARGRVKAPGFFDSPLIHAAWCGATWIGPSQGSLDPLKEANAAVVHLQNGIKTHEEVTREVSGGDWEANVEQLRLENQMLGAAAQAVTPATDENEGDDADVDDDSEE